MKNNWESNLSAIIEEKDGAVENVKKIKTKFEETKAEYADINQRNKVGIYSVCSHAYIDCVVCSS